MIRFHDLSFTYNGAEKSALQNVTLNIEDGEFILVTGPSGGGKSTLARCFNGLIPHFHGGAMSGVAEVQGMDILKHSPKELAVKVGMVFQDPENQMVTNDVEREIAFGLENLGFPTDLIARRIEEALDTVGIANLRSRRHDELSGGEKQKVAIASVLALHPEILVLDEPTSELDPQSAEEVLRILERLNDELGITIVLIEHRLDRVIHIIDRMVVMSEGRILASGRPSDVMRNMGADGLSTIGIPPVVRLMQGLYATGSTPGDLPLTVKDARLLLQKNGSHTANPVDFTDASSESKTSLTVDKLWFAYEEKAVLKDISLKVNEGEFIVIMGRNASGKTTLAKHMNGLLRPGKGRVILGDSDIRRKSVAELSTEIGYVFQNPNDHLFADTVEDEIAFGPKKRGVEATRIASRVEHMLDKFGLSQYRHTYPRYLSGGEKQRLALATVLVNEPRIIVLDEPTRGMDYALKKELIGFLKDHCKKGCSIIMITHDVEIAAECADRVILLSEGRVVTDGTKRQVLSKALLFSPQINRLAQALRAHGIADTTLTVEEMLQQLL